MSIRAQLYILTLLFAAATAVYWTSFGGTLYLDQWKALIASTGEGIYGTRFGIELINQAMIGMYSGVPLSYHIVNFLFHLVNMSLAHILVKRLTGEPWLGLCAAAMLGISYAGSEAVFWPLIYYPLFTAIVISGILLAIHSARKWHWVFYILAFLAGLIATSLMEIGLLMPLVFIGGTITYRSLWRRFAIMASFATIGGVAVFIWRTLATAHSLPYGGGNLLSAGTFIKLVSGWLLMAFTPTYQTFKLFNLSTILSWAAASLVMLPMIATVGIACMFGKNRLRSKEIYFAIFIIASITLVIIPFASIREKTALPVIGSRYLYVPYALFVLGLFLALKRILVYRNSLKVIVAVCAIFTCFNIAAIRHEAKGWAARSEINRSIINKVEQEISNGRNPRNIVLVSEDGQAWFEPQLPPMQSHSMVVPDFIREMLVFETKGKFGGNVYLGSNLDNANGALLISLPRP